MTINVPKWQIHTDDIGKIKITNLIQIEVTGKQVSLKNKIND